MIVKQGQLELDTLSYNTIPDLWHIAQNHPNPVAREAILKCWHAAHAYRKAVNVFANKAGLPDMTLDVTNGD